MRHKTIHPPQLAFGKNRHGKDCWKLYDHRADISVCLEIRYMHGGPPDDPGPSYYTVLAACGDEGDMYGYREAIRPEELDTMMMEIELHEGEEAANKWLSQEMDIRYLLVSSAIGNTEITKIANELKARWEAMLTLGLFSPSVTL